MKYVLFYCSFVILAFYALSVLSIKCYVCKEPDLKCRDPFQNDTMFLKDCSQVGMGNATMCRKYMWESKDQFELAYSPITLSHVFYVFPVGDGVRYYMRGCAVRGRVSRKQGRDCIERLGMFVQRGILLYEIQGHFRYVEDKDVVLPMRQ